MTSDFLNRKEFDRSAQENNQCRALLGKTGMTSCKVSDADLAVYVNKERALENVSASLISFSSKVSSLSPAQKKVVIMLQGNPSMKVDAADLVLKYSDNLTVISVKTGESFASYPKNKVDESNIYVSGVASINEGTVRFGEVNKPFVTLVIEKKGDMQKQGILTVDEINTKIFYQGVSVLDTNKEITQITL